MKTTLRLLSAAALLGVLTLAGCAEGPTVPSGDVNSPESAGEPIVLLDKDLADSLAVDLVRTGPNGAGFLTVQAALRNRTSRDLEVQVQTVFFDGNGVALNSEPGNEGAWTSLVLTANQTTSYRGQAISRQAQRFTVRVRWLRH